MVSRKDRLKTSNLHTRRDWTTEVPDNVNGHEWKKFRVVPRSHPSPYSTLSGSINLGTEGWNHFHCIVEPSLGHIGCRDNLQVVLLACLCGQLVFSRS